MKRNKVIAMLLGMGLMAGTLAVPVTIPKTTVYAAASTQQVIGHGETANGIITRMEKC